MTADDRREQEAAEWLAALDAGHADRAAFERWRRDPVNALAFIRIDAVWRSLDGLRGAGDPEPVDAAEPEEDADPGRRSFLWAAALVGAVAAGGTMLATRSTATVVETAVGERRRLYVDPAVCVDLNTASRLRWWRGGSGLVLELERGEALVTRAAEAPACTLRLGGRTIDLAPGQFDARLFSPERVDLVILKGAGRLPEVATAPRLRAGRRLVLDHGRIADFAVDEDAVRALDAWPRGELLFQGETLAEAIAEYNRYLRRPMVLTSPDLGSHRLGGRFLTDDPSAFLHALSLDFAIGATERPDSILLSRR